MAQGWLTRASTTGDGPSHQCWQVTCRRQQHASTPHPLGDPLAVKSSLAPAAGRASAPHRMVCVDRDSPHPADRAGRVLFTAESRQHPRRRRSRRPGKRTRPFRSPRRHPRIEGRCRPSCRWFPIDCRRVCVRRRTRVASRLPGRRLRRTTPSCQGLAQVARTRTPPRSQNDRWPTAFGSGSPAPRSRRRFSNPVKSPARRDRCQPESGDTPSQTGAPT